MYDLVDKTDRVVHSIIPASRKDGMTDKPPFVHLQNGGGPDVYRTVEQIRAIRV